MSYTNKELIMMYFAEPDIKTLVEETCGVPVKLTIDEQQNIIFVSGPISSKSWQLKETVKLLRNGLIKK